MERKQLFYQFMKEYEEWAETGRKPKSCIQDAAHQLEVQKKRLDYFGIKMICKLKPYKDDVLEWRENNSNGSLFRESQFVERELTFQKDGKTLYHTKNDQIFSQEVLENPQGELTQLENYECPNCGSICQVKDLLEGCSYCGTKFIMQDLYPTVNNYGFTRTDSSETSIKKDKYIISVTQIIMFVVAIIYFIAVGINIQEKLIQTILGALLFAIISGFILGRFIFIFYYLFSGLNESEMPHIPLSAFKTPKRLNEFMRKYDPNFQYDCFEGKIISLLKTCILSNYPQTISRFTQEKSNPAFKDIIDIIYNGHMLLRNSEITNDKCRLDLRAYFISAVYKDEKVISKGQMVDFTVERDIDAKTEVDFKIHAATCTSCGASFDAAHQKTCPHCKTLNNIKEQDWIITKMDIAE